MNKNILIFIGAGILIAVLGIGGYFFLIPRCPESCDDGNPCTQDICSKETNYKCSYTKLTGPQPECSVEVTCGKETCKAGVCQMNYISDCCGNKICEVGEIYMTCPADCPNCDDNNECTKDYYDYYKHKCINTPILDVICCGNGVCEAGETYKNCSRDCPNCEDDNKCTKDSYDYYGQKCINKLIIPCCGNEICDEGVEAYSICSTDCPNCDDNNKLTGDSFNYATQKCENPVTHYFIDDFEKGTQNWEFPEPTAWSTIIEDGNTVLRGTHWAKLQKEWDNFIFKFKFKRIDGSLNVNFRHSCTKYGCPRYLISMSEKINYLIKELVGSFETLQNTYFAIGKDWHTLEIRCYNNIFNIYIDDELLIKYKDTENPLLSGIVSFEVSRGGRPEIQPEFLFDDVEIKLITEEDIVYP